MDLPFNVKIIIGLYLKFVPVLSLDVCEVIIDDFGQEHESSCGDGYFCCFGSWCCSHFNDGTILGIALLSVVIVIILGGCTYQYVKFRRLSPILNSHEDGENYLCLQSSQTRLPSLSAAVATRPDNETFRLPENNVATTAC